MTKAALDKQLIITVENQVGTLAEINKIISGAGINMVAICAYAVDNKGVIMFVSDNHSKSKRLLKAKGFDIREEDVILLTVGNKPGALEMITEKISDSCIDLTLLYGSVDKKGKTSRLVLISEDNDAVMAELKG